MKVFSLAQQIAASREAIGKYERNEALSSVETAKKIADGFSVTVDYLVDETVAPTFDKPRLVVYYIQTGIFRKVRLISS
nr:helix-turn-helix domain-containing protein [Cytophagales bacterium]